MKNIARYSFELQRALNSGVDVASSATILSGQTWGVLLMWSKGLLDFEGLPKMMRQSMEILLSTIASEGGREFIKTNHRLPES